MRTLLTLERKTRSGRLIERRQEYSHSFTQYLMELLYICHAQIQYAAGRGVYQVDGGWRAIDSQYFNGNNARANRNTLIVAAPAGNGQVWVSGESQASGSSACLSPGVQSLLPGELIGIQLGNSNQAVTPQDKYLIQRIPHGQRTPVSPAASLDAVITGDNNQFYTGSGSWNGFYVITKRQMVISSIRLLLYRNGTPGIITMQVLSAYSVSGPSIGVSSLLATATTNGDTLPTAAPYEWREFTLSSPVLMLPGMGYHVRISPAGSGGVYWRANYATNIAYTTYPRTWNTMGSYQYNYALLYDLIGTTPREIEYGSCEVSGLSVANPNASFIIRRLFTNNSGGDATVRECGIYAGSSWSPSGYSGSFPLCICRDVISPDIIVANGEVLAVTYSPQITV